MAHAHFRERSSFAVLATDVFTTVFRGVIAWRASRVRKRTLRTLLEFDDVRLEDLGLCRLDLQEALASPHPNDLTVTRGPQ